MAKRSLCMLLALVTLFSLAAPALAGEAPEEEPIVTEEPVEVTEEPIVEAAEEPAAEAAEEPVVEAEEPVVEAEEPVVEAEEPAVEVTEEPVEVTEEPVEAPEAAEEPEEPAAEPVPAEESGTCGSGVTYTLTDDGVLTIFGSGTIWGEEFYGWSSIKTVVIENGVTGIGERAFSGCTALTSVTIPDSVTSIGEYLFDDCINLKSVMIGNGVTEIPWSLFYDCTALTSLTLGKGVISISYGAFSSCKSLTTISGHAFTYVQTYARENGYQFTPVDPAATVSGKCADQTWTITAAGRFTLTGSGDMWNQPPWTKDYGKYITEAVIGEGITSIGDSAFSQCKYLTSVTIPGTVTSIGYDAFRYCTSLAGVTIPGSVKTIGTRAFMRCTALTSATLGSGVTSIGDFAFSGCSSLTSVAIPDGVTSLGTFAFYNCTSLTNVTIPDSVKSIGKSTFCGCTLLTSVMIPAGVAGISDYAFSGCTSLANVTILNPKCSIYDHQDTMGVYGGPTTIHGYDGSTAQTYAEKYGYPFESLGPVPTPVPTATPAPTATPKPTATPRPTVIPRPTATPKPSVTPKPDVTSKPTPTPKPTAPPTPAPAKLATPKITKMENTASGLKVTWGKVDGAVRYTVFYKLKGASKWTKIGTTTATSYTRKAKDLKSGKTYVFTIRCVKNDKKTYTSDYDKAGKSLTYYAAPTVKIAKASNGIKVTWNKVDGSPRYMVYYRENGGSWKKIGTTTSTSYTRKAAHLKNGVTYEFTVRCVKNDKKTMLSSYKASNSLKYKK